MVRSRRNRSVAALIAAAVLIAGCSGSDDDASPTTEASPETTEATPETTEAGLTGEGLDVGLLAPSSGLLATLFQGQQRGADFAVEDVNDGGGVLEGPLTITTSVAEAGAEPAANVTAAVDGGAQALIGPAGSSGGREVRDEVVALDSTICSASATVPSLTLGQDPLALFRTAVPDDVTATYLAGQIISRRDETAPEAPWKVAIVARGDAYGQSIGNTMAAVLQSAGLVPSVVDYNPRRVQFTGIAQEVAALQPDVSILVTYEEGANLLSALVSAGLDPATMIGLDAFFSPRIAELATAGTEATAVDGFQMLGTMGTRAFLERLFEAGPERPGGERAAGLRLRDGALVGHRRARRRRRRQPRRGRDRRHRRRCHVHDLRRLPRQPRVGRRHQLRRREWPDRSRRQRRPHVRPVHLGSSRSGRHHRSQQLRRRHQRAASPVRGIRGRFAEHADPVGAQLPRLLHRPDRRPRQPRTDRSDRCLPDIGWPAADRGLGRRNRCRHASGARRSGRCADAEHDGGPDPVDRTGLLHRPDRRHLDTGAHRFGEGAPA